MPGPPPPLRVLRRVPWKRLAIEYALLQVVLFAYTVGRFLARTEGGQPFENAHRLMAWEAAMGLALEEAVQDAVLAAGGLIHAANWYYAYLHFTPMMAFLVWVYLFRHPHYSVVRNAFLASTLFAFILQVLVPTAPPRLVPESGLSDTLALYGSAMSYDREGVGSFANHFAALPSIHWGWAAFQAGGLIALTRTSWRWLALIHPLLMMVVIVATGNHFWLDAAASLPVMGLPVLAVVAWDRRRRDQLPLAVPTPGLAVAAPADEDASA